MKLTTQNELKFYAHKASKKLASTTHIDSVLKDLIERTNYMLLTGRRGVTE